MADVILVLNAGSSSIKFSAFDASDESLELLFKGQIEGVHTAPRFVAFAAMRPGSAWGSTRSPTRPAVRASAQRAAR